MFEREGRIRETSTFANRIPCFSEIDFSRPKQAEAVHDLDRTDAPAAGLGRGLVSAGQHLPSAKHRGGDGLPMRRLPIAAAAGRHGGRVAAENLAAL